MANMKMLALLASITFVALYYRSFSYEISEKYDIVFFLKGALQLSLWTDNKDNKVFEMYQESFCTIQRFSPLIITLISTARGVPRVI